MTHPRFATTLLAASLFGSGASSLIFEYGLAASSSHLLGDSIFQFSLIVGIMMFAMGLAVYFQRFIGDQNLLLKFATIETLIALLGGFTPLIMYGTYVLSPDHLVAIQYSLAASLGLLVGFEIPVVLRINRQFRPDLKENIASTFSWDYIGGFVGTLVWLALLSRIPLSQITFIAAIINFSIALATLAYLVLPAPSKNPLLTKAIPFAIQLPVLALLVFGYQKGPQWANFLESKLYDDPIALSQSTKYQHIVLTKNPKINDLRCYLNGNLQFSSLDEHIYHEQLVHPVMSLSMAQATDQKTNQKKRNVLILGGGDGLAAREVLKYPINEALLVDLDPQMTELAKTHPLFLQLNEGALSKEPLQIQDLPDQPSPPQLYDLHLPDDQNTTHYQGTFEVFNADAFQFIQSTTTPWDVVIVDFPDPNSIETTKLYSRTFYRHLYEQTPEHCLLAIQATSPYHARNAYLCILKTIRSAGWEILPYQDNVPSFGQWGWVLAWKPSSGLTQTAVIEHFLAQDHFPVETRYLHPQKFLASTVFEKNFFESADQIAINTLQNPYLLQYYLDSWQIN